jgi:hypothetical protein
VKRFVSQDARRAPRAIPPEALSRFRGALEAERARLEALEARLGELTARLSPRAGPPTNPFFERP